MPLIDQPPERDEGLECPKGRERDVVYRLRHGPIYDAEIDWPPDGPSWDLLDAAADEIESLREELAATVYAHDKWQKAALAKDQACRAMAREIERLKEELGATVNAHNHWQKAALTRSIGS